MQNMPLVSILMNCYNCEKYVKEAIDSVYAQSYENFEIIFIDNCSTDGSAKITRSYDERLKYYKTPQNMNLCKARVFAKEFIKGDFFCVLDTDDLWFPDKLEKQVKIMQENEDIGIVYTNTLYFSDDGDERKAYDSKMPSGYIFDKLLENYFFSFETVMVRKSVMDEHNIYFDDKYNVSSDAEFFIKLSYFTKVFYLDEILAKWRYGHGSESDKSLCLFPKEYEILLNDLSNMIDEFEEIYKKNIEKLRGKINNMYGLCHWSKGDFKTARKYFKKAIQSNKKYILPYVLSFLVKYKNYKNYRKIFKKV